MWKTENDDGDWETDPDFINNVTEQEQRWGSKTIEGSGRTVGAIDMNKLREETTRAHEMQKQLQKEQAPNASYGYGGKFGIEKDRMDKSAVGHDYVAKVEKHMSQTDYSTGFGGKFGIQTDRVDKSAVSWDHKESIEKHASQKDYSSGFGGKFGVEKDRQDKSAVGWDHVEKLHKHDSQTVDKKNNTIVEQTQKPSQIKAKFENLAKQNEIKPTEKNKPISLTQKTVASSAPTSGSTFLGSSDMNNIHRMKLNQEALQLEEKKQNLEAEELQEKMKQIQIENDQKVSNQKLLDCHSQDEVITAQEKEIDVTEISSSENLSNNFPENEINANVFFANDESLQVEPDECYTAIALYDYQAAADDEISFDPDDIITNIEKIDEGWWRGTCNGQTGLFPANYVQLKE